MAKKIASIVFSLNILVFSFARLPLIAYAEELPNRDDIRNQIIQDAQNQVNNPTPEPVPTAETTNEEGTNTDVVNTGDDTTVSNDSTSTDTVAVENENYSEIDQSVDATANTGHNQANGNISINGTGAGIIQTGDATVQVVAGVSAGNNMTAINGGGSSGGSSADVVNSGDGLAVSSTDSATTYRIVRNNNTTIINQAADVTADTGNNEAEGNISVNGGPAGVIITGNASTSVDYLVTANGNITIIGGTGGNGPGDGASIILTNTGDNSRFNTSASNTHLTLVTNENRALISQTCGRPIGPNELRVDLSSCTSNTGNNHADGQIAFGADAGVIKTGDAQVNVVMNANANNNTTGISGSGNEGGSNTNVLNTGDDVDVDTSSNNTDSISVGNYNDARVSQNVNAYANTGYNTANGNISFGGAAGWIQTGNATVNVIMNADVNNNTTVADGSASMNGGCSDNCTNVVNTGDDVTVNSNSNNTTTVEVTNTNVLNLTQRVNSYTNTGGNSTDGNIGSVAGIIITGNANSSTDMEVHANTNCTLIGDTDTVCPTNTPNPTSEGPTPTLPPVGGPSVESATNNNNGSSSSSNSSSNSSPSTAGQVLGAVLPATGPEAGMLMLALSIVGMVTGARIKKYN